MPESVSPQTSGSAQVIAILGMHRSGTSCLTGSLQAAGLHLGKHHTWNRHNLKGNRENQDFVDFHDALLADNKASWDQPPRKLIFSDEREQQARALVRGFDNEPRWGFKDPRALLCLPLWNKVLPERDNIGIFRHPLAVTQSLRKRDPSMSEAHCLSLWLAYNRELYKQYKKEPFPLLCFDWQEQQFHDRVNRVITLLDLKPLNEEQRFYSASLHTHNEADTKKLPWRVRHLYKKLQKVSSAFFE